MPILIGTCLLYQQNKKSHIHRSIFLSKMPGP